MEEHFNSFILEKTKASLIGATEVIQDLWSGYGQIIRMELIEGDCKSVVVKYIDLGAANSHPRGWITNLSHQRKVKSYEVEMNWYAKYGKGCKDAIIPKCLGTLSQDNKHCLILEDLNSIGFPVRKTGLEINEIKVVLHWLAHFHGCYMSSKGVGLWEIGTYWHLDTRPDELKEIEFQSIKNAAKPIDRVLNNAIFKTLVHGDAKLANFCFSKDVSSVAAVDFQYVGKGCGMKDVAYFLSSCLLENELETLEEELLTYYFSELKKSVNLFHPKIDFKELKLEWSNLYSFAWADFTRFLLGWMPTHQKLNGYSMNKMNEVVNQLKN